ncbi:MAG: VTT domain-containing protein, partial [Rickettsiales bacterium]
NSLLLIIVFSLSYIAVTALSLPIATILTLLGGALFGFINGLIIVSFTSTIGATLAFLMARFLLKDWVQNKYGKHLKKLNTGFAREGAFYLFALRLAPVFPFFLVNMLMALLPIKTWTFFWVSQLGMLAGTAIYVYAGTELSKISAFSDIASPKLLLAFTMLGVFPLIVKKILPLLRKKKS